MAFSLALLGAFSYYSLSYASVAAPIGGSYVKQYERYRALKKYCTPGWPKHDINKCLNACEPGKVAQSDEVKKLCKKAKEAGKIAAEKPTTETAPKTAPATKTTAPAIRNTAEKDPPKDSAYVEIKTENEKTTEERGYIKAAKKQIATDVAAQEVLIDNINNSKVRNFLMGTNDADTTTLKNTLTNNTSKLKTLDSLLNETSDSDLKEALKKQIMTIQQQQDKVQETLNNNEESFNFFGWVTKLFGK